MKNMLLKNKKYLRGYTLVEMVVVIAIVGVVSTFLVASFVGSQATWALDASSRELTAILRQAENSAATGRYIDASKVPCLYGVDKASTNQYVLYYKYRTGTDCTSVSARVNIMTYTLRGGATFQSFASPIEYSLPRGDLNGNTVITLADAPAASLNVCISQSGMVVGGITQVCP